MNAKHQKQIPTPPFCFDCSSFMSGDEGINDLKSEHRCAKFPLLDLVTGKRFNMACNVVRSPEAPCGEEGKMFTPKDDLDGKVVGLDKAHEGAERTVEPDKTNLN